MKLWSRIKEILRKALQERASPRERALSVALGAFIGSSPLIGLHMVVAVPLATLLRLNRVLAVAGTNLSFGPIVALIAASEVWLGSRMLGLPMPKMDLANALSAGKQALGAWWLGFALIGPVIGLVVGLTVYIIARWGEQRAKQGLPAPDAAPAVTPEVAPDVPPGG